MIQPPKNVHHFPAPAKLNLFLHIVGRRDDGYHLLETIFQFIDLEDDICLLPREDGKIVLHTITFEGAAENDLTVKAARLLKKYTQTLFGADIWYHKHIPVGAGLGGGSSDAATVLLALNHLWQTNVSRVELQKISLELGADVPVFVSGKNAFASGVGEKLTEIQLPDKWFVIIYPSVAISTQRIFSHKDLTRDTPSSIIRHLDNRAYKNDMQSVVVREYPLIAEALNALKCFGEPLMTGSGSCVFLAYDSEDEAKKVFQVVSKRFDAYCVKGLPEHPLYNI